jgi:hypothetical protein
MTINVTVKCVQGVSFDKTIHVEKAEELNCTITESTESPSSKCGWRKIIETFLPALIPLLPKG